MKKKSVVAMRMELVDAGQVLGYPRLPYSSGARLASGEKSWMTFASTASMQRLAAAHRNAVILARYHLEVAEGSDVRPAPVIVSTVSDEVRERRIAGLAKARAIKAARKAERV